METMSSSSSPPPPAAAAAAGVDSNHRDSSGGIRRSNRISCNSGCNIGHGRKRNKMTDRSSRSRQHASGSGRGGEWSITDFRKPWNQHYVDIGHCRLKKCTDRIRSVSRQDIEDLPTSLVAMAINATSAYGPKERQDRLVVEYVNALIERHGQREQMNMTDIFEASKTKRTTMVSTAMLANGQDEELTSTYSSTPVTSEAIIHINDSYRNQNALALAAYHGYICTLKLLLDIGCPLVEGGGRGSSINENCCVSSKVLFLAVKNFQTEALKLLIKERPSEIKSLLRLESMKSCRHPLTIFNNAVRCGNVEAIKLLRPLGGMLRCNTAWCRPKNLHMILASLYPQYHITALHQQKTKTMKQTRSKVHVFVATTKDGEASAMTTTTKTNSLAATTAAGIIMSARDDNINKTEKKKESYQSIYHWCPELHWSFPGPDRWMINWFWHTMTATTMAKGKKLNVDTMTNQGQSDNHYFLNGYDHETGNSCNDDDDNNEDPQLGINMDETSRFLLPNDVCLRVLSFVGRDWWTFTKKQHQLDRLSA